ncbi:hypothetical protein ACT8ZV_09395 [Nocardioides sp. MAHUQ-72]|uniref:hypothetical protein n=1 Tax=unclassified Nocardioides TaxID=2615069 RepID=UPI00360BB979
MGLRGTTITTALLVLALAGCSSSDAEPEAGGSAGASSSPQSGSASASADPDEPTPLDPCAMTPEKSWQALVPAKQRSHVVLTADFVTQRGILLLDDYARYACQISYDNGVKSPGITWGYFPQTFRPHDLEKVLEGAGGTRIPSFSYPAFTTGDFTSSQAIGLNSSTAFFVSVDEKLNSVMHGDTRTKDRDLVRVLKELGGQVPLEEQTRIDLPADCPGARSDEVSAAYGPVDFARGGEDGDGRSWCLYINQEKSSQLSLRAFHLTDEAFESFYDQTKTNPNRVDMFDGPPGVIRMISLGEDGSADSIVLDPESHFYVDVKIESVRQTPGRADRGAVIALARAYADLVSAGQA